MEKYQDLILKSKKTLNTADHLAYITYPLVNDVKVLLSITENIYISAINAMDSLIEYDILYKKINPLTNNFDERFDVFKGKLKERYQIEKEFIDLLKELRSIITSHKGSHATFMKENKMYIYTSEFRTKSLDIEDIKNYIAKIKRFINKLNMIYRI